ncbi:MAG: prepilin-type N-terminal cleavage/methylation domain-containing protein [Clostridia bacterium]
MSKSNSGQTLIELVVSIAIFSIVSLAALSFFGFTINIYYQTVRQEQILYESRLINYACETSIKKAEYYEINSDGDLLVYNLSDESDDVTVKNMNDYIGTISTYMTNFSVIDESGLITFSFTITVADETSTYTLNLMAPQNYS